MSVTVLYSTTATATGGRDGRTATADGAVDHKLVTPKELGGAGGEGANPEQLFAAGYAACFLSALKYVAVQAKVKLDPATTVTAQVGIGPRADGTGFGLTVALHVGVPNLDDDTARDLMARAHVVCPYSHATKGNIDVTVTRT